MVKRFRKSIAVQMMLLVLGSTALVLALVEIYSYVHTRDMILETRDAVGRWEDIRVGLPGGKGEFYGKIIKVTSLKENNWEVLVRTTSLSAEAYPLFSSD